MPTIYREGSFRVVLYPGSREHGPPHVHVFDASGEVVVLLGDDVGPALREVRGMREMGARRAVRIVEENQQAFLHHWRRYHG
jgi:hypothetical protein